jgi:hypothetical protein
MPGRWTFSLMPWSAIQAKNRITIRCLSVPGKPARKGSNPRDPGRVARNWVQRDIEVWYLCNVEVANPPLIIDWIRCSSSCVVANSEGIP